MKTNFTYIMVTLVMLTVMSCAEKMLPPTDRPSADLVPMEFITDVDVEVKTTFDSRKVHWEDTDEITVFSVGEGEPSGEKFRVKSTSADRTSAIFEGLGDPDAAEFYAVYPHNSENRFDKTSGSLTIVLPAVQEAVAGGFASESNVSVAYSSENTEGVLQFRNLTTLLCIRFDDADDAENTSSITVKAKKNEAEYWGLSGQAEVKVDTETGMPAVVEGSTGYVTLSAPAGGFIKDALYYIPVYPIGECVGFELGFTDLNGDTFTKTNNTKGSLDRNWIFSFGSIPDPYPDGGFDFATLSVSWAHIQWVAESSLNFGGVLDAGVKVFVNGLTDSGQEEGFGKEQFEVELGYGEDADPSGSSWIWKPIAYNGDWGSDYYFQGKSDPINKAGNYYYSFRIRYAGKDYVYAGDGGLWDAGSCPCKTFSVKGSEFSEYAVTWANVQWAASEHLSVGNQFEAGTKILVPGLTDVKDSYGTEQFEVELGYGVEPYPTGLSWIWSPVSFNADWGNEYYFQGKTSAINAPGTYYCAFRIRFAGNDYVYADRDGLWDGTSALSKMFTVSE